MAEAAAPPVATVSPATYCILCGGRMEEFENLMKQIHFNYEKHEKHSTFIINNNYIVLLSKNFVKLGSTFKNISAVCLETQLMWDQMLCGTLLSTGRRHDDCYSSYYIYLSIYLSYLTICLCIYLSIVSSGMYLDQS